jgi:hypothetical protein
MPNLGAAYESWYVSSYYSVGIAGSTATDDVVEEEG